MLKRITGRKKQIKYENFKFYNNCSSINGLWQEFWSLLIDTNRVGPLTKEIRINQLDSIFKNDSIVRNISKTQFLNTANNIEIYDKDGTPLLILEPVQQFDSTSTIGYIQIIDPKFQTAKGLNIKSTFGEVVEKYAISRIENTLNSAVIFIDELNLYLTIDKKNYPPA